MTFDLDDNQQEHPDLDKTLHIFSLGNLCLFLGCTPPIVNVYKLTHKEPRLFGNISLAGSILLLMAGIIIRKWSERKIKATFNREDDDRQIILQHIHVIK